MKKLREEGRNPVVVDVGDFMSTDKLIGEYRNEFIFRVMEDLDTDAAVVGTRELSRWDETTKFIERGTVPFITTNLKVVEDGVSHPLAYPYVVREIGGVKVGFVGVMGSAEFTKVEMPEGLDVVFEDPRDALRAVLPKVQAEAEVIVLLAHMDGRATEQLAGEVDGVDVVLAGYRARADDACRRVGNVVLNEAGIRGQWAGIVRLIVSTNGEVLDWGGRNVSLDAAVDADPETQRLVDAHEAEADVMRKAGVASRQDKLDGELSVSHFIGVDNCQSCHPAQYDQWLTTAHAKAYQTLVDAGKAGDEQCVGCHVTGWGDPSGYTVAHAEPELRNVGCESCHGMGTDHARGAQAKTITESDCLTCHDTKNSPNFEYDKYLKAVVHK